MPAGLEESPLIVRVAGLPARVLEPLSSRPCLRRLGMLRNLEARLQRARSEMVDALYRALPQQAAEVRGFLLEVKRHCFNGRRLERHESDPRWANLKRIAGSLPDGILELEARAARAAEAYEEIYRQERDRERRHLLGLSEDPRFARALALASPDLVVDAQGLARGDAVLAANKERRIERSLLRYVTRAAAKLSPFSTLTTVGFGKVCASPLTGGLRFLQGERREISLFRLERSLLDRYLEVLLRHPAVRSRCWVALNDTVEEVEAGRYRFLRPARWEPAADELKFSPASQVKATLGGPLIPEIRHELSAGPLRVSELTARLAAAVELPAEEAGSRVEQLLESLVSLGYLLLLPPWPTHAAQMERELLKLLREIPAAAGLGPLAAVLERLVEKEEDYCQAPNPQTAIREIQGLVDELLEVLADRAPVRSVGSKGKPHRFYEDVFVVPRDVPRPEVLEVPAESIREIMSTARALGRFSYLFGFHHDFLHALAAFWADRWPRRRMISVLELFHETKPLWQELLKFDRLNRSTVFSTFDPMGLAAVKDLDSLRHRIYEEAQALMKKGPAGFQLRLDRLERLVDEIPDRYAPFVGPCVFVQPADPQGDSWVLNRLFEGTGRYCSRYTAVMEEPLRSRYVAHLVAGSTLRIGGEDVELLDL